MGSPQTQTQTPAAPNSALGTLPTETSIHSLSTTNRQNSYRHTQTTKKAVYQYIDRYSGHSDTYYLRYYPVGLGIPGLWLVEGSGDSLQYSWFIYSVDGGHNCPQDTVNDWYVWSDDNDDSPRTSIYLEEC